MLAAVQKYKGFGVIWGLPIGSRMSSSIVWAVDACQDVLEFYRILWQALVARQEAFMLHLYSYICLQQLVPELGFLEFHALVPRTIHVYQCKSAKHNKRILPCTTAKSAKRNKRVLLDQSPQEAAMVVCSTNVQRLFSACSTVDAVLRLRRA